MGVEHQLPDGGERPHDADSGEHNHDEDVDPVDRRALGRADGNVVQKHGEYEIQRDEPDRADDGNDVAKEREHCSHESTERHVERSKDQPGHEVSLGELALLDVG